ncbi:MAG: hypothetical protein GX657_18400 [Chloroflexi bacterium]|nr:hypothetical protein [Chloroflexota bacterium]
MSGVIGMPEQAVDTNAQALFDGLVFNEAGEPAQVAYIGGVAHYAVPDDGFLRHVAARSVDDAVLDRLQEQVSSVQDELVAAVLKMLGKEDIFTKAALEASVRNLKDNVRQSEPQQWAPMLRLMGFRIVVNVHGEVVEIIYPEQAAEEE